MDKYTTERVIDELESKYNPNNDLIANSPRVTWADRNILDLVIDLIEKVEKLEAEVEQLKSDS